MNKFSIPLSVLFCFLLTGVFAQHRLSGKVSSAVDSLHIEVCTVALNNGELVVNTDSIGRFHFDNLTDGSYTLSTHCIGFITATQTIVMSGKNKHTHILIYPETDNGDTIEIVSKGPASHLGDVVDMGIYAGKKSEVIVMDSLVVNTATNNARQVYSRVPGLNIWENDGAGIQLGIGGRGLDPNRTSNFNVRQNGYDISADALGYPESYYTPPTEGIERIQLVRGAASLQYGTQFGGMLNFIIRKPVADKKIQLVARQSLGTYGKGSNGLALYNTFTSLGGTVGKVSYYTYFQYKTGNGWRPNSDFDVYNYYGNVNYQISKRTSIGFDLTIMSYLAHQPGGLSDDMFNADPRQSNRARNWFQVNWRMAAVHFSHKFNETSEMNVRVFGLLANRYSIGFRPNRVATVDDGRNRDLIKGEFRNIGAEIRYMKRYYVGGRYNVLLMGARGYYGNNLATQGLGTTGSDANFSYVKNVVVNFQYDYNDYTYRNKNLALFAENIFYVGNKLSITPGLRFEYINTSADGYYGNIAYDLAGNIILNDTVYESRSSARQFLLGGIGISYKPTSKMNIYGNISQNYRSITFSDMRVANPSSVIDPNMKDERGYTMDIGLRSENTKRFIYDASFFILNYNNRIGEYLTSDASNRVIRERTNIGRALMVGVECYMEYDVMKLILPQTKVWSGSIFTNSAYIHSEYVSSGITAVQGNQVEFVPEFNLKAGARAGYKKFKMSFQYTHLTQQFSDATNAEEGGVSGVVGIIPAYTIMDLSMSYEYKIFKFEANINNITNQYYFTRRATGYPGPGILPSDGRAFYFTLQVKI
ncbi:TonB-dependent receptor domain-containing protein [Cytophaga aurantiaca]|uniref:TonB-dependent receptor domain-containing protein n=1 Tax=Cytophaga aurantiaca TaxID=29530 RepID=UPI00036E52D0|nr:TonB-dependent receptor [Cytophaga aurantiaca]